MALHAASTVFTKPFKQSETRERDLQNLKLIMTAMRSLQRHWKMTEAFIIQLSDDLRRNNINISAQQFGSGYETIDNIIKLGRHKLDNQLSNGYLQLF